MQKIPVKKKLDQFKLNEYDKNLALIHRNEIYQFFSNNDPQFNGEVIQLDEFDKTKQRKNKFSLNENKIKEEKFYQLNFDEKEKMFYLSEWDHSKIESFGVIRNKKLYLSVEESLFLLQNFIVKFIPEIDEKNDEKIKLIENKENNHIEQRTNSFIDILFSKDINLKSYNLGVYSHLRRSGKIVICPQHIQLDNDKEKYENFYIFFDTVEDYRNRSISGIIYIFHEEEISINDFDLISKQGIEMQRDFYRSVEFKTDSAIFEKSTTNIYVSFVESENITFLKISETNPINSIKLNR